MDNNGNSLSNMTMASIFAGLRKAMPKIKEIAKTALYVVVIPATIAVLTVHGPGLARTAVTRWRAGGNVAAL